jgi:dipeptidyl aminopeptidase/acylaminoacyl peptidase
MRTVRWITLIAGTLILIGAGLVIKSASAQGDEGPGLIVFASDSLGDYEIFTLDPETGQSTRLTTDPGTDLEPVWSPDGETIAFVSDRDGDFELYVMKADGSDLLQLTFNEAEERLPRWQPGGEYLVYMSNVNGQWDVFSISADGAVVRQITNDESDERGPQPEGGSVVIPPSGTTPSTGATPFPTATIAPVVEATVTNGSANVRSNPGGGASIIGAARSSDALDIVGRYSDNTWVQVVLPGGQTGWVYAPLLTINIDLSTVPVINAPFIAPPPTATPSPIPPTQSAVIISFTADRTTIHTGECATLTWVTEGIAEVYYQGTGTVGNASRQECPTATTSYNLRVVRRDGVVDNRYITITVTP